MRVFKNYTGIILLVIVSLFTIRPLFIDGFFPMHDDTQPARVYEMAKSLKDGMLPVRWVADLGYGYGYPIFNFYGPLSYYVGAGFNLIGFDALVATKLMIGIGFVLAGISMYLLAREFWGEWGGVASGLLYLYAPYHAVNLYVRGDIAEIYAYGFIPLVFLAVYKLSFWGAERLQNQVDERFWSSQNDTWTWVVIGSLSYAAVILSHNLTAMMVTPVIFAVTIVLGIILYRKKKKFLVTCYMLYVICLGLALSAFYWLPTLTEMKYTNILSQIGGKADYRLHFVCLPQLWDSPWGFGGSAPGCADGMSFRIGKLHVALSLFALLWLPYLWRKDKRNCYIVSIVLLLLIINIFLTIEASKFIWDAIPLMDYFQYPWRFLLLISFFASFLGGSIVWDFSKKSPWSLGLTIIILASAVFLYGKLFTPQTILPKTAADYTNENSLKWTISKISDEYLPPGFKKPESEQNIVISKISIPGSVGSVKMIEEKTQRLVADITAREDTPVLIRTAYFPAWQLFVDGRGESLNQTDGGMMFDLPAGEHSVLLHFTQTPVEKIGNIVSLVGIVVLVAGIIRFSYEKTER